MDHESWDDVRQDTRNDEDRRAYSVTSLIEWERNSTMDLPRTDGVLISMILSTRGMSIG
jgi:hypothetical protein